MLSALETRSFLLHTHGLPGDSRNFLSFGFPTKGILTQKCSMACYTALIPVSLRTLRVERRARRFLSLLSCTSQGPLAAICSPVSGICDDDFKCRESGSKQSELHYAMTIGLN
jgi:hypothetical protein